MDIASLWHLTAASTEQMVVVTTTMTMLNNITSQDVTMLLRIYNLRNLPSFEVEYLEMLVAGFK